MAYRLRYSVSVDWVGDGVGPMSPSSAQSYTFTQTVPGPFVPGGDAPTQANFNTALSGSSATPGSNSLSSDIATQIAAKLSTIQAWASGGN